MKGITIFSAYRMAEQEKQWARYRRKNPYGIAIDDDANALMFQRRDRQSVKFEKRLVNILKKVDSNARPV